MQKHVHFECIGASDSDHIFIRCSRKHTIKLRTEEIRYAMTVFSFCLQINTINQIPGLHHKKKKESENTQILQFYFRISFVICLYIIDR